MHFILGTAWRHVCDMWRGEKHALIYLFVADVFFLLFFVVFLFVCLFVCFEKHRNINFLIPNSPADS